MQRINLINSETGKPFSGPFGHCDVPNKLWARFQRLAKHLGRTEEELFVEVLEKELLPSLRRKAK